MTLDPRQRREHAAYVLAHVYETRRRNMDAAALSAAVRVAVDAGLTRGEICEICPDDSATIDAILSEYANGSCNGQEPLPF